MDAEASGALRNGAPFADMPQALQQLRRGLLRESGGDKVMAQVLAIVPAAGLGAVLVAVELALESGPPSGRVSVSRTCGIANERRELPSGPGTRAKAVRGSSSPAPMRTSAQSSYPGCPTAHSQRA